MPVIETMTILLGAAVAKAALKLWLKDSSLAQDISIEVVGILGQKILDVSSRNPTKREFERIGEKVAERLAPFFEHETSGLPENEQQAAALAAADTLNKAAIGDEVLFAKDLDPLWLERHLRDIVPDAARDLGDTATILYDKILREACNYVIEIVTTLPDFSLKATREILKREGRLINLVEKVLDKLPNRLTTGAGDADKDTDFETQYRREVARKLDRMELFGVTVSEASRRYNLTVGYISLTAAFHELSNTNKKGDKKEDVTRGRFSRPKGLKREKSDVRTSSSQSKEGESAPVRVDAALAHSRRTLIRGEAGSGKTTLLHWLAVQSARSAFTDDLADWNDAVPFFIPLRRYLGDGFPRPENFVDQVAENTAGEMPQGWVHRQLRSGRALVMIDGVDELPEFKRNKAREWLINLANTFPDARYVVTSRPPAVDEGWLEKEGFADNELQPMALTDIDAFIDHWHDAAQSTLTEPDEITNHDDLKQKLKVVVRESRPIRSLATSPLLCAMLCALNRERKTQLPKDRIELYRIALETLLERRDVEREIPTEDLPDLTRREKELLLQDFAYWLLINSQSDAERPDAEKCVARVLEHMPHVHDEATAVFRYLLERSGLLREPVAGHIDFIHRTFQEYLGAKAAIEENDIGLLIEKSHEDQWREVIVLAAGHALKDQREKLIRSLLNRGNKEPQNRHRLHLLAIACLETSPKLSPALTAKLQRCLKSLIPPQKLSDARSLASAGELAVPLLSGHQRRNVKIVTACVRALELIGGDKALEVLKEYGPDARVTVYRELARAWSYFDPESFAQSVLADSPLDCGHAQVWDSTLLPGVPFLRKLERLECNLVPQSDDLSFLSALRKITHLELSNCTGVTDITPLAGMEKLENLSLNGCESLTDITPLLGMKNLKVLYLNDCANVKDLTPLAELKSLEHVSLFNSNKLTDLSPLAGLVDLKHLNLGRCTGVSDLSPLIKLKNLELLSLNHCPRIADLAPLTELRKLDWLVLSGCTGVVDFGPISELEELEHLNLGNCTGVVNLAFLERLEDLQSLDLSGCDGVTDLSPLAKLQKLGELNLEDCMGVKDLTPLNGLKKLIDLGLSNCTGVTDIGPLLKLKTLLFLDLDGCSNITDLAPVKGLKNLQFLAIARCTGVTDESQVANLVQFFQGTECYLFVGR